MFVLGGRRTLLLTGIYGSVDAYMMSVCIMLLILTPPTRYEFRNQMQLSFITNKQKVERTTSEFA